MANAVRYVTAMTNNATLYSQVQVAKILGVSRTAVANKIKAGKLEAVTVGNTRFVPKRAIVKWQKQRAERARKLTELL